jgi:NAD(P)H-hydrate epimerase
MVPILNTKQIKELDALTVKKEGILSIDLMERACRAFVDWFVQQTDATQKVAIVCGTGNNGGDGLGIARLLQDWGYPVKVWIVRGVMPESNDFKVNFQRIKDKIDISEINQEPNRELFADRDLIVDAIFGSGLSRPPEGTYAQTIRCINQTEAIRIAVDMPSGLSADGPSSGEIVRAHYTVSFQLPKLAFFLPQSYPFTGEWVTVDIGLNKSFIKNSDSNHYLITQKDVRKILKPRSRFDHKGKYGHALMISGSYGKMGAALLASRAALRSGPGLLTVHIPKCGYSILQTALPEAMTSVDTDEMMFTELSDTDQFTTIGIGPGLGQKPETVKAFAELLNRYKRPMVVDADALNILSAQPSLMAQIPENSILTPHPKEFERLVGKWGEDFERLEKQKNLAKQLKSVIVLKGAYSSIATPDGAVFFNPSGNPICMGWLGIWHPSKKVPIHLSPQI